MAVKYAEKKRRNHHIIYVVITAAVICAVLLAMVSFLYDVAEDEAYEMLHLQTKQIKDDLSLQMRSDRENLETMANFAAKLYADGESYDRMFASFKPIGLIANIGILNADNTFVTKAGKLDLNGKISFEEEAERGAYVSGRVADLTQEGNEIIRSAVPIRVGGKTVGILYGVIKPKELNIRYNQMAAELSAQLFVFEAENGNLVIDTFNDTLGNISMLKTRKFNDGHSYEELVAGEKGYSSFRSIFNHENLYAHYSSVDELGWRILLARYESQVFQSTHEISSVLFLAFFLISLAVIVLTSHLIRDEKRESRVVACASNIRKLLLEVNQQKQSISLALKQIVDFADARSAFVVDADGEDHNYIVSAYADKLLCGEERTRFVSELFRYVAELYKANGLPFGLLRIRPNNHLETTNTSLYQFLKEKNIKDVSYTYTIDQNNHVSILGCINPKKIRMVRNLLSDVAVCFSIALFNKKHLNKTEITATTDSLTGAFNRVAYNKDILVYDEECPRNFSCIYIDVNELNLRNNKYGHAAGDEMLMYIANTLKDIFFGQKIYRMGGDEFLVFVKDVEQEQIKKNLETFTQVLSLMDYHVAIGVSFRTQNSCCEDMVREAEIRMYEEKSRYYQSKEQKVTVELENTYIQEKTGLREIDTLLSAMQEHYNGIYRVSLDNDHAHRILMPEYLGYRADEDEFSKLMLKYMDDYVHPDFRRALMSFLKYDAIKRQLATHKRTKITYKKINGEHVVLSVYPLGDDRDNVNETLWIFAKS